MRCLQRGREAENQPGDDRDRKRTDEDLGIDRNRLRMHHLRRNKMREHVEAGIGESETAERASNRFATFAQAMRRTNTTAPNKTSKAGLISPTISSCNALTAAPMRI